MKVVLVNFRHRPRQPGQVVNVVDEPVERRGGHLADVFHGLSVADEGSVRRHRRASDAHPSCSSCPPPPEIRCLLERPATHLDRIPEGGD